MIRETIDMLGLPAKDRVTGFCGVITSVCFDLYGCVQVVISPQAVKDGTELAEGRWFDVNRVTISDGDRVMPLPDFDADRVAPADYRHGAAEKRLPSR